MINPAISSNEKTGDTDGGTVTADSETGYKSSERAALENQLLQIETVARAIEQQSAQQESETDDMAPADSVAE